MTSEEMGRVLFRALSSMEILEIEVSRPSRRLTEVEVIAAGMDETIEHSEPGHRIVVTVTGMPVDD